MRLLADAMTNWMIAIPLIVLAIQVVQAAVMWNLDRKTDRIDSLEDSVKNYADELIEQKLETERVRREEAMKAFAMQMGQVLARLESGEQIFEDLRREDTKLKVEFIERLSELKDAIHRE